MAFFNKEKISAGKQVHNNGDNTENK